jgi:c-di-GMP-binding flagellar brake protein YcgR
MVDGFPPEGGKQREHNRGVLMTSSERRIEPRIPVRIHLMYRLMYSPDGTPPEEELHNGNNLLFNVSRGGFFLLTKNFLEIGSMLQVEFILERLNEKVKGKAQVVRANNYNYPSQGHYEYGLQFEELASGATEILDRFIGSTK